MWEWWSGVCARVHLGLPFPDEAEHGDVLDVNTQLRGQGEKGAALQHVIRGVRAILYRSRFASVEQLLYLPTRHLGLGRGKLWGGTKPCTHQKCKETQTTGKPYSSELLLKQGCQGVQNRALCWLSLRL